MSKVNNPSKGNATILMKPLITMSWKWFINISYHDNDNDWQCLRVSALQKSARATFTRADIVPYLYPLCPSPFPPPPPLRVVSENRGCSTILLLIKLFLLSSISFLYFEIVPFLYPHTPTWPPAAKRKAIVVIGWKSWREIILSKTLKTEIIAIILGVWCSRCMPETIWCCKLRQIRCCRLRQLIDRNLECSLSMSIPPAHSLLFVI